jgi:hypothetical protein
LHGLDDILAPPSRFNDPKFIQFIYGRATIVTEMQLGVGVNRRGGRALPSQEKKHHMFLPNNGCTTLELRIPRPLLGKRLESRLLPSSSPPAGVIVTS